MEQNSKFVEREGDYCCWGLEVWREMGLTNGYIVWGGIKNILKLIIVMVTQLSEYTTNQWTVYFKWVNCIVYLNKAIFKKSILD